MPTFTMRLPDEDHEALQAMAVVTGRPMSELVRDAIVEKLRKFAESDEVMQQFENEQLKRAAALDNIKRRRSPRPLDPARHP